jgi:hypothetical protein
MTMRRPIGVFRLDVIANMVRRGRIRHCSLFLSVVLRFVFNEIAKKTVVFDALLTKEETALNGLHLALVAGEPFFSHGWYRGPEC